jgi:hypothetical protein
VTAERKPQEAFNGLVTGPDELGFVTSDKVHLVVSFDGDNASLMGPGTYEMGWVAHALEGLAGQWSHREPMPTLPPTATPGGNWMDCTKTDLTVIFYRDCRVIAMPGEVFGDDPGLAEYELDVVGQLRHDDEYCITRLSCLSEAIAEDIASGEIETREAQ